MSKILFLKYPKVIIVYRLVKPHSTINMLDIKLYSNRYFFGADSNVVFCNFCEILKILRAMKLRILTNFAFNKMYIYNAKAPYSSFQVKKKRSKY